MTSADLRNLPIDVAAAWRAGHQAGLSSAAAEVLRQAAIITRLQAEIAALTAQLWAEADQRNERTA